VDRAAVIDSDLRAVQREIDCANAILIQMKSAAPSHQSGYPANDAEEKAARPSRRFLRMPFRVAQEVADGNVSDFRAEFPLQKSKLFSLTLPLTVVWRYGEA